MTCSKTKSILRLVSGELEPDQERELLRHLECCEGCKFAHADLKVAWDSLGDWRVDFGDVDLVSRVLTGVEVSSDKPGGEVKFLLVRSVAFRAAASILLAVGLGIGAGHIATGGLASPAIDAESPVTDQDVVDSLGLVAFASGSATGLPIGLDIDSQMLSSGGSDEEGRSP